MGFKIQIQRSHSGPREVSTDWNRLSGFQVPLVVEETASTAYVLAGIIYDRKSESLAQLAEEFRIPRGALNRDGRFLFIAYDKVTGSLETWVDKYRLLGTYVIAEPECFTISNDRTLCQAELARLKIDSRAVLDVLLFGYVQPPLTLFVGATMIAGYATVTSLGVTQEDWREYWPRPQGSVGVVVDVADLYDGFQHAVANVMHHWRPNTFRMSAGVDTRLVAGCLSREQLGQLRFQVVCAPYLHEDSERDVIGAKQVASALGVPLEVLHMPPEQSAYFSNLDSGAIALSGLYGGEFLGGVLLKEDDARVATGSRDILNLDPDLQVDAALEVEARARFEHSVSRLGTRRFLTSVYLGSFRSAIYRSIFYGWSSPSVLCQIALSPFSERSFLDVLLQVPDSQVANYALYGSLVRKFMPAHLREIPFSSPITSLNSDLPSLKMGHDPKFRPSVSETSAPEHFPRLGKVLCGYGIRWVGVPSHPLTSLRLHNLQNGLG